MHELLQTQWFPFLIFIAGCVVLWCIVRLVKHFTPNVKD